MSKYIDADKLIEKFEKIIDNIPASVDSGAGYVIDEVYKIIESLQQEQPEVELDREIIKYKVPFTDEREYLNETTLDAIARHFYKLGCKAKKYE